MDPTIEIDPDPDHPKNMGPDLTFFSKYRSDFFPNADPDPTKTPGSATFLPRPRLLIQEDVLDVSIRCADFQSIVDAFVNLYSR